MILLIKLCRKLNYNWKIINFAAKFKGNNNRIMKSRFEVESLHNLKSIIVVVALSPLFMSLSLVSLK